MPDNENLLNTQELEDSVSIDNLTQSPDLDGDDVIVMVHENNGVKSTYKAILRSIANFINKLLHYSTDLHTQNDTIIGAINELADGGGGSVDITTEITTPSAVQTFADGGDNIPLKSCNVAIVAQQAGTGTPSPSNVRSISGFDEVEVVVTGKNLLPSKLSDIITVNTAGSWNNNVYTYRSVVFTVNTDSDGFVTSINANGTATGGNATLKLPSFNLPQGEYMMSGVTGGSSSSFYIQSFGDVDYTTGSGIFDGGNGANFTLTAKNVLTTSIFVRTGYNAQNVLFYPQIEKGSTATAYEPYKGTTHTIPLGQTIYGGTAEIVGGNGTKTHNYITLNGSENWTEYASGKYYATVVTANDNKVSDVGYLSNLYLFEGNGSSRSTDITVDKRFYMQRQYGRVWLYDSSITSLTDLQTMLSNNNLSVVYPLTTPTAFTFAETNIPTLSGVNSIYADSGDIQSLEYFNAGADDIDSLIDLETREFKKGKKVKFDITASHPNNPTAYSIVVKVAGNSVFSKAYACNTYGVFAEATDYFVYDGEIYTVVAQGFQANTNQKMLTFAINDESYEVKCSASNSSYATEDSFSLKVGEGVDARDVYYDNSTSGLTATNLQDAIDEIVSMMQ